MTSAGLVIGAHAPTVVQRRTAGCVNDACVAPWSTEAADRWSNVDPSATGAVASAGAMCDRITTVVQTARHTVCQAVYRTEWARRDSNARPLAPEASALSN